MNFGTVPWVDHRL